jgi:hypothetical protein
MGISRTKLIQSVQAGRRRAGVTDDDYHEMLHLQFGVESTTLLSDDALIELRKRYCQPQPGSGRRFRPPAQRRDQRFVYALWRELRDLGGVKVKGRIGLQKFLEARIGKSAPELMDQQETFKAAEAIKAMIERVKRGEAIKPEEIEAAA